MPGKADKGTGTGRGRPRGPRAPSAQDLAHTRELTQYYDPVQPPLAPVFQQDTGGGVGHVGGEQQEVDTDASVNDLAEDAASSSNVVTSLSTHTNAASSEQTCSALDVIAQQRMTTVMRTRELLRRTTIPRPRGLCLILSRQRLALSRTVCKSFEMSGPSRYDRGSRAQGPLHPRATRR